MAREISRRSFLFRFRDILADSVAAASREAAGAARAKTGPDARHPPRAGELLDGVPALHPWAALAFGLGARYGRRHPYPLLLGASGEAFRVVYSREDPRGALRHSPVNTFLAALAVAGLSARAATGGPFGPALGGVEVTLNRGAAVVAGTRDGPGLVTGVDRKAEVVEFTPALAPPRRVPFALFEEEWSEGWWESGPAPFLRITVEGGGPVRSLEDLCRVGLETMIMLLTREGEGPWTTGLAAWDAFAGDLREDRISGEAAEVLLGDLLPSLAAARIGAWRFLEAIARALPPEHREPVEAASLLYREIHNPDPAGGIWGTGFLAEAAECLLTDEVPDPGKLESPEARERAAGLLSRVRENEARAVERIRSLPGELRRLS